MHETADRTALDLDPEGLLAFAGVDDLPLVRSWMCERLRAAGISEHVVELMNRIPRHAFTPPERWRVAYLDLDLWIGHTWMTTPWTVARVVNAIPRDRGNRILEIGTGSGFQTALLAGLGAEVTTADILPLCTIKAADRLFALGATSVRCISGNGLAASVLGGDFDCIVINAAIPGVRPDFLQLPHNDRLLIAPMILADGSQHLMRYETQSGGSSSLLDLGRCYFLPAIPAIPPLQNTSDHSTMERALAYAQNRHDP